MISRRGIITGAAALIVAPAIVRADNLMRLRGVILPGDGITLTVIPHPDRPLLRRIVHRASGVIAGYVDPLVNSKEVLIAHYGKRHADFDIVPIYDRSELKRDNYPSDPSLSDGYNLCGAIARFRIGV